MRENPGKIATNGVDALFAGGEGGVIISIAPETYMFANGARGAQPTCNLDQRSVIIGEGRTPSSGERTRVDAFSMTWV
jgi:hypothetical protein